MNLVLGRIIIDEKFIGSNFFNEKNIKIVELSSEYTKNTKIPTLIVGWSKVKAIFGDNVSILNKRIKQNIYWTFAPDEKLHSFHEDTLKFIGELYNDFVSGYEYYFIDPVIDDIQSFDNFLRFLNNGICDSIYITDDFIYMFNEKESLILGIDVNYYNLVGYNTDKIKENLINISNRVLIEDYTDEGVFQVHKNHFKIELSKKYIPLLETKKQ